MWDLHSLTRDRTQAPALKAGALTTGPPRKSLHFIQNSTRRHVSIWVYTFSFPPWFRENFRIWEQWQRRIGNLSESWNVNVSQEFRDTVYIDVTLFLKYLKLVRLFRLIDRN